MVFFWLQAALAADPVVTQGIVNGAPTRDFPAAVSLGAGGFSMCSGSLITPRIVLTAGHCSAELPLELLVQFGSAYFGRSSSEPDHSLGFVDVVVHPGYVPLANGMNGTLGEFDLSVVILEEDAPVDPVWILEDRLGKARSIGAEVTSVGFGVTGSSGAGSGTKRAAVLTVDDVDDMFVITRSETNADGANICSGDSGGPQYGIDDETGEWVQWAVHSWADIDCVDRSGSTRIDIASDWIWDHVEAVHGTTDRCAFNRHYDDGVCDPWCPEFDMDCYPRMDLGEGRWRGCNVAPGGAWGGLWVLVALAARRRR